MSLYQAQLGFGLNGQVWRTADKQGLPTGQSAYPNDLETLPSEAGFWWLGHIHSQEYKDSKEVYLHLRCVAHTF